ncbi:hypothetical protein [Kribbella sp. NPDC051718]|uniref:hypothetical protein n=1 Tax=Kribbella sp. NPDC051718 TaxID=3155168 RepID=UPI00343024F6
MHLGRCGLPRRRLAPQGGRYDWIGREAIVEGWLSRQDWQAGGWEFEWSILAITGDTAAVGGTGVYRELGTFSNLWTVTLDQRGKCVMFRMWNNEISV